MELYNNNVRPPRSVFNSHGNPHREHVYVGLASQTKERKRQELFFMKKICTHFCKIVFIGVGVRHTKICFYDFLQTYDCNIRVLVNQFSLVP